MKNEERIWKSLFLRYSIYEDRIRIQSILIFYHFDIPYEDIEKVDICNPPVVWDIIKNRKRYLTRKYGFGFRIIKNDLADLSRHIAIEKRTGYWRQIRITPKNPEEFLRNMTVAMKKWRGG